jgi:hypothetical protein
MMVKLKYHFASEFQNKSGLGKLTSLEKPIDPRQMLRAIGDE